MTENNIVNNTSNILFTDLFNLEEIQQIQDAFAAATGVASIITDLDGKPITKPSNFSHLCQEVIRQTKKGLANCFKSDACLGRMNPDGPIIQPCLSGGLWDAGTSIQVGDRHIANWLIGQVLDESCDMDAMLAYAREIGANEDSYRDALGKVTRMSKEQFAKIGQALFLIAGQLSRQALLNVQQKRYIAELKQAENALLQERDRAESYLNTVETMIVGLDADGNISTINRRGCQVLGYREDELLGRSWFETCLPQPEGMEDVYPFYLKLLAGETDVLLEYRENHVITRNGELRQIAWHNAMLHDEQGRIIGTLSAGEDITERKQMEDELRRLNEELETRVRERTAELETKNAELERMNRLFVGRELRMVELKKTIQKLKEARA